MRERFLIFFIILLIISITPISASERSELANDIKENNAQTDKHTHDIVQHGDNIEDYICAIPHFIVNIFIVFVL
ncbi:MAG: hypothetical protein PHY59_09450 [Methanobacterium sp.]|nr:hypothetical protein [Methanobacterium sp.]